MRVLIISGQSLNSETYSDKLEPHIEGLLSDKAFSQDINNKVALLVPGTRNHVQIKDNGLIIFELDSLETSTSHIPNLTPNILRELNGFMNEFKPNILHSFDEGSLGIMAQFFAITKKIPYILSIYPDENGSGRSFATRMMLSIMEQVGLSQEFVKNYYNNATAIVADNLSLERIKTENDFDGFAVNYKDLKRGEQYLSFYKRMMLRNKEFVKSKRFAGIVKLLPVKSLQNSIANYLPEKKTTKNTKKLAPASILLAGAAIIGSIITFAAVKGISKLKKSTPKE